MKSSRGRRKEKPRAETRGGLDRFDDVSWYVGFDSSRIHSESGVTLSSFACCRVGCRFDWRITTRDEAASGKQFLFLGGPPVPEGYHGAEVVDGASSTAMIWDDRRLPGRRWRGRRRGDPWRVERVEERPALMRSWRGLDGCAHGGKRERERN